MKAPNRFPSLDVLRCAAVLLILGRHIPMAGPDPASSGHGLATTLWFRGGWIGVDLFFVLSGFLIAGLLFREYQQHGRIAFGRFLIRRGLKIYPAFYCLLAWGALLRWPLLNHGNPDAWSSLAYEALFLQNYFQSAVPWPWFHTWSLAVEEHFYLLLPLLFWVLIKWRRTSDDPFAPLLSIGAGLGIGILLLRIINAVASPYHHNTHLFPTHLRLDALLCGVALAYLFHFRQAAFVGFCARHKAMLLLLGLGLLSPCFIFPLETTPFIYTVGLSLNYLGSGMILAALVSAEAMPQRDGQTPAVLRWIWHALAAIGARSYSIYLWHVPVLIFLVPVFLKVFRLPISPGSVMVVYLLGSLLVGSCLAKLIETPVLFLRDRWFPSRSGTLPVAAKSHSSERSRSLSAGELLPEAQAC